MGRRFAVAAAFSLAVVLLAASVAGAGGVPGARSFKVCAGAGAYWPTETLAIQGTTAWIACKERLRVVKFDLARGRTKAAVVLDGPVIAVTTGFGSVWALDSGSTLYRIDPRTARVRKRIALGAQAPYNIWVGAGAVWVVDDGAGQVIRVSPGTNREVRRIATGDGPADMVFQGTTAWVVNHRDRGLIRLDTRTNKTTRLATLESVNAAPERMALLGGSLWVTGRGMDLLRVRPDTGEVSSVAEVGGSGIDVVAAAGALWVPARSAAVDTPGFPTMEALRRVALDGTVTTVARARGRVDVHGLAAGPSGSVWFADNIGGVLYRVPAR